MFISITVFDAFVIVATPITIVFLTWSLNKLGRGLGWWFLLLFAGPIAASIFYVQQTGMPPAAKAGPTKGL
jgi:hypothetical protein